MLKKCVRTVFFLVSIQPSPFWMDTFESSCMFNAIFSAVHPIARQRYYAYIAAQPLVTLKLVRVVGTATLVAIDG